MTIQSHNPSINFSSAGWVLVVTAGWIPFYDEQVLVRTTGLIVFLGYEFLSFFDSQLSLDDFRNVEQAMKMFNSLDILPAIKYLRPDLWLRSFFLECISKIEAMEGEHVQ